MMELGPILRGPGIREWKAAGVCLPTAGAEARGSGDRVLPCHDDPVQTYSTNVIGTVRTLEAVRQLRRRCVGVNVTTDKCYENQDGSGLSQDGQVARQGSVFEQQVVLRTRRPFLPCFVLSSRPICGAWRGRRQCPSRQRNRKRRLDHRQLVPAVIAAFLHERPVVPRHLNAIRPWQHVLDCLAGYLRLGESIARGCTAPSGEWTSARTNITRDARWPASSRRWPHVGRSINLGQDERVHAPEDLELRLDVSKAATALGWRSRLSEDEAIGWVAAGIATITWDRTQGPCASITLPPRGRDIGIMQCDPCKRTSPARGWSHRSRTMTLAV